jgi:hypothetical protein
MKLRLMMCTIAAAMAPATVLLTASGTALAQPAPQSRTATPATPAINGFNVEEVARLDQGVRLQFDLYGTPGGNATLNLDGANRALHLTEVEPGQYTGSYVIGTRDRLKADSRVTAELRMGNEVATSVLREPLVRSDVAQPADDTRQLATKDSPPPPPVRRHRQPRARPSARAWPATAPAAASSRRWRPCRAPCPIHGHWRATPPRASISA